MKRRDFLVKSTLSTLGMTSMAGIPLSVLDAHDITRLTILHTNDVHSRIEPFPMDGGRNEGQGGVSRRATLVERVRKSEDNVLLFDCGDIFQYDACTIGNHDFDGGIQNLHDQMPHADFPFLIANYDFDNTILNGKTQPFKIFERNGVKIGVFGLGIELNSLVPRALYKETQYQDPLEVGNRISKRLRYDEGCDFVICLSHLGYKYRGDKVSDVVLAENSEEIDVILGGHTHTFMNEPDIRRNKKGEEVVVNQAGWAGLMLGRLDVFFEKNKKGRCVSCKNTYVV